MFTKTAEYYDKIYSFKNYLHESERLLEIIQAEMGNNTLHLLDVACGTGKHLQYLQEYFHVEGLDLDCNLLDVAHERLPGIPLYHEDMIQFNLGKRYDVITCLFSAIGYVKTLENLQLALNCMYQHLLPGGTLLVEPWFTPEMWHPGTLHGLFIDDPDLKITRMNLSEVDGLISRMDMHYLIGTPQGVEHYVERHELGLFTQKEMMKELSSTGLQVLYDESGLTGRGLYICRKSA
jgi:ubiquinone/menaquinone biosynthesis C-methylase UbiE